MPKRLLLSKKYLFSVIKIPEHISRLKKVTKHVSMYSGQIRYMIQRVTCMIDHMIIATPLWGSVPVHSPYEIYGKGHHNQ